MILITRDYVGPCEHKESCQVLSRLLTTAASRWARDMNRPLFQHVGKNHLDVLPDDLRLWIVKWMRYQKRAQKKITRTYKKNYATNTTPANKVLVQHALPSLTASYEMRGRHQATQPSPQKRDYPSLSLLRQLYAPIYVHPGVADYDHPTLPTIEQCANDIERQLVERRNHLNRFIPNGLYKDDGHSLNISLAEALGIVDAADLSWMEDTNMSEELTAMLAKISIGQ